MLPDLLQHSSSPAVALPLVFLLVLWLASAISSAISQSSGSGENGIKTQSQANKMKADKMGGGGGGWGGLLLSSSCYMTICFSSPLLWKHSLCLCRKFTGRLAGWLLLIWPTDTWSRTKKLGQEVSVCSSSSAGFLLLWPSSSHCAFWVCQKISSSTAAAASVVKRQNSHFFQQKKKEKFSSDSRC